MKTIIAGSRTITDYAILLQVIEATKESGIEITEVISGTARGVDQLGEGYAKEFGLPLHRFPADWKRYGKRAGFVRNKESKLFNVTFSGTGPGLFFMAFGAIILLFALLTGKAIEERGKKRGM